MATQVNPWQTPVSIPAPEHIQSRGEVVHWQGRQFRISAVATPGSAYLLTTYAITLDTGEQFTSRQLRVRERFEFEFEHKGRMVLGLFESRGLLIEGETYRLSIDDMFESEGRLSVENWWKSQLAGVGLGMLIAGVALGLAWL